VTSLLQVYLLFYLIHVVCSVHHILLDWSPQYYLMRSTKCTSPYYAFFSSILLLLPLWPYGAEKLERFLDHMNGLHRNTHFTMQIGRDGHLLFLDNDIHTGERIWTFTTRSKQNLPPPNFTWTLDHTTIPPTNNGFFQPWRKKPGICDKESLDG